MSEWCGEDAKGKTRLSGDSVPTGSPSSYVESKLERTLGGIKPD